MEPNPIAEPPHKQDKEQKCVSVIFNPTSGQSDPDARKKTIVDALAEHGYTCQFIATTKEEGARELTARALESGADLLAVSGGDGTVMEAMSALVGTDTPIAVFPAGTGNLLSVNLGIPTTVPEAVAIALSGKVYKLDLAKTSDDKYFAIMGGIGMDAQVIHDADREAKNKFGLFAYALSLVKNLKRRRAWFEISLDDAPPLKRRAKTVMLANMGKMTGGLQTMPTAVPDDGLLDISIVRAHSAGEWLRLAGYALLGKTHIDPSVDVFQAKRVKIATTFPEPVQFDGEDAGRTRDLTVEVVPRAVGILVPDESPVARAAGLTAPLAPDKSLRRFLPLAVLLFGTAAILRKYRAQKRRRNQDDKDA